jgi:hypothetical protein
MKLKLRRCYKALGSFSSLVYMCSPMGTTGVELGS